MTEYFPLERVLNQVGPRIDLNELIVDVDGDPVSLANHFATLEDLLFSLNPNRAADFSVKEKNLKDDFFRAEIVVNLKKIKQRLEQARLEQAKALFKNQKPAWANPAATEDDINFSISALEGLVNSYAEKIKNYLLPREAASLDLIAGGEDLKDPGAMTLEELSDELKNTLNFKDDRAVLVNNEFLRKIGGEKDEWRVSWHRTVRGLAAILGKGDSGLVAFDVWWGAIMDQITDKTSPFVNIARALFIKKPEKPNRTLITAEDYNKSEINDRALEVYEYIVRRIKHHGEFGGWDHDPDGSAEDATAEGGFGYAALSDDRAKKFLRHLEAKFSDIPADLLEQLIKYAWAMTSKSDGFIPWLMHRTTRKHGLALPQMSGQPYIDELFVAAPWAAGMYSRNRYALSFANATSEELLFLPKELLKYIHTEKFAFESAQKKIDRHNAGEKVEYPELEKARRTIKNYEERPKEAERLWEIINLFRETIWGSIPPWVIDLRERMVIRQVDNSDPKNPQDVIINHLGIPEARALRGDEIDLNSSLFPMPGELLINIMRIQQQKDELISRRKKKQAIEFSMTKLTDKAQEYAEEFTRVQTRIGDINVILASLNPATDATRIADLTNEKNDLTLQFAELERIYNLISQKLNSLAAERMPVMNIETEIDEFIRIYSEQGYGETFAEIGRKKLESGGYKPDDYTPLAFEALQKMFRAFRTPEDKPLSLNDITEKMKEWQDAMVGKAKLIPGKHHLLFGPFTVRYIHRLFSQFEGRFDQREIRHAVHAILDNLTGAEGLPAYTDRYVRDYLEVHHGEKSDKKLRTLLRAPIAWKEQEYTDALWSFIQNIEKHGANFEKWLAALAPLGIGKKDEHGEKLKTIAPWIWDPVSEDTAKGDSKSKH